MCACAAHYKKVFANYLADHLKMNVRALSPRRSSLIAKGMIYSPGTGLVAFTVPLFAEYLKRAGRSDVG